MYSLYANSVYYETNTVKLNVRCKTLNRALSLSLFRARSLALSLSFTRALSVHVCMGARVCLARFDGMLARKEADRHVIAREGADRHAIAREEADRHVARYERHACATRQGGEPRACSNNRQGGEARACSINSHCRRMYLLSV